MTEDTARIRTDLLVSAQVRRLSDAGVPVYVARKGAAESGTVLVRVPGAEVRTARLWSQTRDLDGTLGWLPAFKGEAVADGEVADYIDLAVRRDPDLWVVEAEPTDGRNPFDGKEISPWPTPSRPPSAARPSTAPSGDVTHRSDGNRADADPPTPETALAAAEALFKRSR